MNLMKKLLTLLPLGLLLAVGIALADPVDFQFTDTNGKPGALSDYRGKWVVVNYWATWCPPCLEEIPDLVRFHDKHAAKDAVVIGVNFEDIPLPQLKAFIDENLISYPVVPGNGMDPVSEQLPVGGLPTTYLISPQGELVARQVGGVTAKVIEDFIARKTAANAAGSDTQ